MLDDDPLGIVEFVPMLPLDFRPLCLPLIVVVVLELPGLDIVSVDIDPEVPGVPIVPMVPASGDGLVPDGAGDIWAVAAVAASIVAAKANIVFMVYLLKFRNYCGVGLVVGVVGVIPLVVGIVPVVPVTPGLVDTPGASVPTLPSPIVPAVDDPIGGVTPVDGCGRLGETADPGTMGLPSPDGVWPFAPRVPAGAYAPGGGDPAELPPTTPPAPATCADAAAAIPNIATAAIEAKRLIIVTSCRVVNKPASLPEVSRPVALAARPAPC